MRKLFVERARIKKKRALRTINLKIISLNIHEHNSQANSEKKKISAVVNGSKNGYKLMEILCIVLNNST